MHAVDFDCPASLVPAARHVALEPSPASNVRTAASFADMHRLRQYEFRINSRPDTTYEPGRAARNCTLRSPGRIRQAPVMPAYPHVRFLTSANRREQFVADSGAEVAVAGR